MNRKRNPNCQSLVTWIGLPLSISATLLYGTLILLMQKKPGCSRGLMRLWGRAVLFSLRTKLVITGLDNVPKSGFVAAVNHTSYLDTFIYPAFLPPSTCYIGKAELEKIPLVSRCYKILGNLYIDRKGARFDQSRLFQEVLLLQPRRPIFIHPEGTRQSTSQIGPFYRGFVRISTSTGRPIVPIVSRNGEKLWPKSRALPIPGVVKVSVGVPMSLQTGESEKDFAQRVRNTMIGMLSELSESSSSK